LNKRLKAMSCALAAIFTFSLAVNSPNLVGPFGVDAVSAATGDPAPATPSKPSTGSNNYSSPTYSSSSSSTGVTRLLKLNSTGSDVKLVQTSLNNKGYKLTADGIFGNLTLVAVKDYQGKNALAADGLVGPATCSKLIPAPVVEARLLTLGTNGTDVKLLQTSLNKNGFKLISDGFFGNLTLAAVKSYQSKNGLAVDGLVGPATQAKLNPKPVTPTKPTTPPVVTPPVVVPPVDVVSAASLVDDAAGFEKSIGKDGKWIVCATKDITTTKDLVVDGTFKNGKKDDVTGAELIQRKIALYTQDDKRVVTARFTLTAPKLTINSPMASIEHGTFKGDLYVSATNFKLKDAKVVGNVYFVTQDAKDTFTMDATSSITGKNELLVVDAVSTASIVDNAAAFEKAIGTEATGGKWIITSLNDITTTKELVLDGMLLNGKKDADGDDIVQRKIGLYTQANQDGERVVTNSFTLTAPKLTIKSPEAKIQNSTFKGDLYVSSRNFLLTGSTVVGDVYVHSTEFKLAANSKIEGNVYFDNLEAKKTFVIDDGSSVTGTQTLSKEQVIVDSVSSASLVDTTADLETAISKDGKWIIAILKDLVSTNDLVIEGELLKDGEASDRKLAIYWHDGDRYTTAKYTLQAPTLTLKTATSIQKGTFIGDLYIEVEGCTLKETQVIGNVYFATQALKDAFELDELSSISGVQEVKVK
jgi:peptidoglycan hydrolase-like protein with peptidoglycan-binding domain